MNADNDVIISVKDLKKYYNGGEVKALDGVTTDIRKGEVELVARVILIEYILRVVVLVEESQRHGRLRARVDADRVGIDAVLDQVADGLLADAVVARLANERGSYT